MPNARPPKKVNYRKELLGRIQLLEARVASLENRSVYNPFGSPIPYQPYVPPYLGFGGAGYISPANY